MSTVLRGGLRGWRNANAVTLEELSDVTGYSIATLSRVERGERCFNALQRIRLARLLGAKVRDLFPVAQEPDPATDAAAGAESEVASAVG